MKKEGAINRISRDIIWLAILVLTSFTCFEIGRNYDKSHIIVPIESSLDLSPSSIVSNTNNDMSLLSTLSSLSTPSATYILPPVTTPIFQPITPIYELNSTDPASSCVRRNGSYRTEEDVIADLAPPFFLSYPGSGGQYVRSLIELSTGILSGHLGTPDSERDAPKNEYFFEDNSCDRMHSVVQGTHPVYIRISISKIGYIFMNQRKHRRRCRAGKVYGFKRIILLVRDPIETILADYINKYVTDTSTLKLTDNHEWIKFANDTSKLWYKSWDENLYEIVEYLLPGYTNMIIVRYEDIMNPKRKLKTLQNLATYILGKPVNLEQLECAIQLTENRKSYIKDEIPVALLDQLYSDNSSPLFRDQHITQNLMPFITNVSYPDAMCPSARRQSLSGTSTHTTPTSTTSTGSSTKGSICVIQKQWYTQGMEKPTSTVPIIAQCAKEFGMRIFKPLEVADPLDSINLDLKQMPLLPQDFSSSSASASSTSGSSFKLTTAGTITGNDVTNWSQRLFGDLTGASTNTHHHSKQHGAHGKHHKTSASKSDHRSLSHTSLPTLPPPPLLLSYPGSGNTWARLLVEFSTGVYSGSIDLTDMSLKREILGEVTCDPMNVVVKAHPINVNFSLATNEIFLIDELHQQKCKTIPSFNRVLFLVRNPYNAIMAEFQRSVTQSHVATVEVSELQDSIWHKEALTQARHYHDTWTTTISYIATKLPKQNVKIVWYEHLIDKSLRVKTLGSILDFLGFHYPLTPAIITDTSVHTTSTHRLVAGSAETKNDRLVEAVAELLERRLDCTFKLSQNPKVYREKTSKSINVTYAYRNQTLADMMWTHLKPFSEYAGYSIGPYIASSKIK